MEYLSTRNIKKTYSFKDVFLKGLAPDGGLFIPKKVPLYSKEDLKRLKSLSYQELASDIILKFCSDEFSKNEVNDIVNASYKNFRISNEHNFEFL